jgi:hypothetical protein
LIDALKEFDKFELNNQA